LVHLNLFSTTRMEETNIEEPIIIEETIPVAEPIPVDDGIGFVGVIRLLLALAVLVAAVFVRKIVIDQIMSLLGSLGGVSDENKAKAKGFLGGPISVLCIMGGVYLASILADLPDELDFLFVDAQKSFLHIVVFYVVYHSIAPVSQLLHSTSTGQMGLEIREVIVKVTKVLVCVVGLLSILQGWGVNVSAFLTGLGLAGMAVALAAQDTMKNFFGTIVVLADNIFHVGDWIKTPQVEGIVEHFGLRTTFIRGFDTSQITIPNATLADTTIVNFNKCTQRQICWTLPVVCPDNHTSVRLVDAWRSCLENHPGVSKERLIIVQLDKFGCACMEVFVLYYTKETVWIPHLQVKQDVILQFNTIIAEHNSHFGVPTTAVLLSDSRK